jgi:hypothetical protein
VNQAILGWGRFRVLPANNAKSQPSQYCLIHYIKLDIFTMGSESSIIGLVVFYILLPETFCRGDVLLGDILLQGDVLLRRHFVRRRFVEETFCKEMFCMCVRSYTKTKTVQSDV